MGADRGIVWSSKTTISHGRGGTMLSKSADCEDFVYAISIGIRCFNSLAIEDVQDTSSLVRVIQSIAQFADPATQNLRNAFNYEHVTGF